MSGLELLTGFVTAPGATLTALGMAVGNSLAVRNFLPGKKAYLLQCWTDSQATGFLQIRSPNMHDFRNNLRFATVAGETEPLLPWGHKELLTPTDILTAELSGSAVAGDIETACLLVWYEELLGIAARLFTWDQIKDRIVRSFTSDNTLALGTAGGYSGQETIIAEIDNFRANTDYAVLGYQVNVECACVRIQGVDTGNLGVGGPGQEQSKWLTGHWFKSLSIATGLPTIPVINSNNKGAILIDGAQDENGADTTVEWLLAELRP